MLDFAVLGAGPAGATAALCLARRGALVALVDVDKEPAGETLPPEITPVLRELGLFDEFLALRPIESPGIVSCWEVSEPQEQDFVSNPNGPGWHVDRPAFDRMLRACAAEAGAKLAREAKAGFIIDATGANAIREPDDVLLAIVLRLEGGRGSDLRTYIDAAQDGWWYSAPGVAMFFTDPETYREQGVDVAELLRRCPLTRSRIGRTRVASSRVVQVRCGLNRDILTKTRLHVGDSAAAYDPLSGLGIWKALRTGVLAHDPHACADLVRREYAAYATARDAHYARETRWPGSGFWRRRVARQNCEYHAAGRDSQ